MKLVEPVANDTNQNERNNRKEIHPEIRLYLATDIRFFGPGPYRLLRTLLRESSLKSACAAMDISYSKGLKIIDNIEKELNIEIVQRRRGGVSRGQSELTEAGRTLLLSYESFISECENEVRRLYTLHFPLWND